MDTGQGQKMDLEEIKELFLQGMQCGETCGAVTGALMVLGMKYGHSKEGDVLQKEMMKQKTGKFKRMFAEKYPSCICQDLLGHDISRKEELEQVMEKGLLLMFCPKVVEDTIEILRKMV